MFRYFTLLSYENPRKVISFSLLLFILRRKEKASKLRKLNNYINTKNPYAAFNIHDRCNISIYLANVAFNSFQVLFMLSQKTQFYFKDILWTIVQFRKFHTLFSKYLENKRETL